MHRPDEIGSAKIRNMRGYVARGVAEPHRDVPRRGETLTALNKTHQHRDYVASDPSQLTQAPSVESTGIPHSRAKSGQGPRMVCSPSTIPCRRT